MVEKLYCWVEVNMKHVTGGRLSGRHGELDKGLKEARRAGATLGSSQLHPLRRAQEAQEHVGFTVSVEPVNLC